MLRNDRYLGAKLMESEQRRTVLSSSLCQLKAPVASQGQGFVENSKPLRENVKREQYGKECAEIRWSLEI
jgi:hypothetical protein